MSTPAFSPIEVVPFVKPVTSEQSPFVSIVMPVYNEQNYIGRILNDVLQQDYPRDRFEIIVADGNSSDLTRPIINALRSVHTNVRLIENPARIVSTGLNRAISFARGEIIVRLDGHCEYPRDYVRRVVELRQQLGADNVGGVLEPVGENYVQKAVAAAYYSPIGLGGAALRGAPESQTVKEVDAVHGGCWKKMRLLEVGGFDEQMIRNQDDELSFRLRKNSGRIFQSSTIRVKYHVRDSFEKLFRQFTQYGFWKVKVVKKHPQQASLRHYIPALFVLLLLVLALLTPFSKFGWVLLSTLMATYVLCLAVVSIAQVWKTEKKLWLGMVMALVVMHVGYGCGFLAGCWRAFIGSKTDKGFESPTR